MNKMDDEKIKITYIRKPSGIKIIFVNLKKAFERKFIM